MGRSSASAGTDAAKRRLLSSTASRYAAIRETAELQDRPPEPPSPPETAPTPPPAHSATTTHTEPADHASSPSDLQSLNTKTRSCCVDRMNPPRITASGIPTPCGRWHTAASVMRVTQERAHVNGPLVAEMRTCRIGCRANQTVPVAPWLWTRLIRWPAGWMRPSRLSAVAPRELRSQRVASRCRLRPSRRELGVRVGGGSGRPDGRKRANTGRPPRRARGGRSALGMPEITLSRIRRSNERHHEPVLDWWQVATGVSRSRERR